MGGDSKGLRAEEVLLFESFSREMSHSDPWYNIKVNLWDLRRKSKDKTPWSVEGKKGALECNRRRKPSVVFVSVFSPQHHPARFLVFLWSEGPGNWPGSYQSRLL